MNIPTWSDYPEVVAGLARKLERDAWEHGVSRADFLAVVGRDTCEYLLDKVERRRQ